MSGIDEMPESVRRKRMILKNGDSISIEFTFIADVEPTVDVYSEYVSVGDWHVGHRDTFTVIETVGIPNSGMSCLNITDALRRWESCLV